MKIGLFGGTFNPIHYGHLRGAEEVREYFKLDKVIFIPSGVPPLKSTNVVDGIHRLNMVKLAIENNLHFEISDYEIKKKEPSYTINTIKYFKKLYENDNILFIIGVDSLFELHRWYKAHELLKMIDFIAMSRPGYRKFKFLEFIEEREKGNCFRIKNSDKKIFYLKIFPFAFSSTKLREFIRLRKSIRYLLPDRVLEYIKENKLYQE